ncbi:unnamed protein product [Ixodes hexagonus]
MIRWRQINAGDEDIMTADMAQNEDVACYYVTKVSWKGRYPRVFSVGTLGVRTYNLSSMEVTNQWPYGELLAISPSKGGQEFSISFRKGRKGEGAMRFLSEHRADIITQALNFKHLFAEPGQDCMRYAARKHHWSEREVPVVLEAGPQGLSQLDPSSLSLVARYPYRDLVALAALSDTPGGLALVMGSFDRLHLFTVEKREELMKRVVDCAGQHMGVSVAFREPISLAAALQVRLGRFSTDEALTSLCEFVVHKVTPRHKEPVKRLLCLTESCLVERDPSSYAVVTLRPLADVCRIVRCREHLQQFSVEYGQGDVRHYTSTDRDALLATVLDGVRASGNGNVHMGLEREARGRRVGPPWSPSEEDVESAFLRFLHTRPAAASWSNRELLERFNSNVPYSGLLHTASKEASTWSTNFKQVQNGLVSILEWDISQQEDLEPMFQALRRLVACRAGFAAFTQVPRQVAPSPVRERIGSLVVRALKRDDPGVTYAAIDMLCALMQPMHDNGDLYQEQLNKTALLSSRPFLESLMALLVHHVERGTGTLVVSSLLDLLTFAMCHPYSETTEGAQFDSLLDLVASHGRIMFRLFQHPSVAIVKGAGMVMRAIIEEGDAATSRRMQELALAEAALPRHLREALFGGGGDSRLLALRQLCRHLVGLWVAGHQEAMGALKRMLPPGLLAFLEDTAKPPAEAVERLPERDNLRLATEHPTGGYQAPSKMAQQLRQVERQVDRFLQHWRQHIHPEHVEEKQTRPVVLRKRRQRVKSDVNWPMFYYQFRQDHARPDLIWNFRTREELRDALDAELRTFSHDQELSQGTPVSWNHREFEVIYASLADEVRVGDYFLRLLLEEDQNSEGPGASYIRRSRNIKFSRTLRFLLATFHFLDVNIKFPCNFCLILVTFHVFVDLVDHGRYRAVSAPSLAHTAKMKLAPFGTVCRQCLAHESRFNTYLQKTHTQTAQERQTADLLAVALEKRNTRTDRRRPYSASKLLNSGQRPLIEDKRNGTRNKRLPSCCSQSSFFLLEETSIEKDAICNVSYTVASIKIARCNMQELTNITENIKKELYSLLQVLLTFDPVLVEKVAVLLLSVMEDNPAVQQLYTTGFFFFVLLYTGSNLLAIGQLLHSSHTSQAFRLDEAGALTLSQRSILGQILPEAMVCYLENHGAAKFAEIFLGEFDTPEAIWNAEMRRFMMEKIASHLGDFTPRLKSNTRAQYEYCPIPAVHYPQLQHELFCSIYYLRHLCDTDRFPDWPIAEPVVLLREVLSRWRQELERKPPELSLEDACRTLGLSVDDRSDDNKIRRSYFRLAQKYHPDKNPDGREAFEQVNKAYEFLSDKSQRRSEGPDPVNLQLILKTQAILFSRHGQELAPYKYAGYGLLIQTLEAEVEDPQLLCKATPLLGVATEACLHTLRCSPLNVEELRREGGLQVLVRAVSRSVEVLNQSSGPSSLEAQVLSHTASCLAVAAQFPACCQALAGMEGLARDLCRGLYFEHLSELSLVLVRCVGALAVDACLQTLLLDAGALFPLLLFMFRYDYTLAEGGVDSSATSNQQEVLNQLAEQSVIACGRLGGLLPGALSSPPHPGVRGVLGALLTPYLVRKMALLTPQELLCLLTANTHSPYLIWDNGTRQELRDYLKTQQRSMVRSGECDESRGADFVYSAHKDELVIGEVFVCVYNEQPTFPLEATNGFILDLLDFVGSQAQYLHSARSLTEAPTAQRFEQSEQALLALHNALRNNPGKESLCIGHLRLLFCLLSLEGCGRLQLATVQVIQVLTGSQDCVQDVASSGVLGHLLLTLAASSSPQMRVAVMDALLPLMSNSRLVKEAISKGALVYLLDQWCNGQQGPLRERTAELLAKMAADKLHGARLQRSLERFLPPLFLDAMRQSPTEALHLFQGNQENPELVWNEECRERLCGGVRQLAQEQLQLHRKDPDAICKIPEELNLVQRDPDELLVAGVYVRLLVQNPGWSLRRPVEFLSEGLNGLCTLLAREPPELICSPICYVHERRSRLTPIKIHVLVSRLLRLVSRLLPASVSRVQACAQALSGTQCVASLAESLRQRQSPEVVQLACQLLHTLLQREVPALVQQAVHSGLVEQLLSLLSQTWAPAATKALAVQALKAMASDLGSGDQVTGLLGQSPIWSDYRDQKHDLFVAATPTAGCLPSECSSCSSAGYLTQGQTGMQLPQSPPPLGHS